MGDVQIISYSPYKIKNILINYLIFFRIILANILVRIFLTIKKFEINKINIKIIKPPVSILK